jgi:hypothetical protein
MLLAGGSLSACAAIWGFEDTLGGDGSAEGGRHDGGAPDATRDTGGAGEAGHGDAGSDGAPSDAAVSDPCTATAPETYAFYVSGSGEDTETCGRLDNPCATISVGIGNAVAAGATIVNIAEGSYSDSLSLVAGLTLVGGWVETGGAWSKDTSSSARTQLLVQAPSTSNTTAMAGSLGGAVTLCTLTLNSKATANPGESLYGVYATGTTTTVHLREVGISVNGGGAGQAGGAGSAGKAGGSKGCSPPGSGAPGKASTPGSPGPLGTFNAGGYLPGDGDNGGPGGAGATGTKGADGVCLTCDTACAKTPSCAPSSTSPGCGDNGLAGCGGAGGGPGSGGGGGGASVAIFAWGATVTAADSRLLVESGGGGAPGGTGGDGGAGSPGLTGDSGASCATACVGSCTPGDFQNPAGGDAGGPGGPGSTGGVGGGGSGGFSCPIVRGGGASVTVSGTAIVPSVGGRGAGSAPPGGNGDDAGVCSY